MYIYSMTRFVCDMCPCDEHHRKVSDMHRIDNCANLCSVRGER